MLENNYVRHRTGSDSSDGTSADRMVINVGGVKFETHKATLQNISDTRLAWLTENADPNTKEQDWFFDRHPGAFVYILNFYRTGKLHTPTDMCGPAFEEELTFWGIDEKQMEPCCWENFTRHREAEENLKNFEGPGFDDLRQERRKSLPPPRDNGRLSRYYETIWKILDDPHSSKGAKVFSLFSCFMIILSVSGYCLSTVPALENHHALLENINYICVVFFTLECTFRLITTPSRKEFMFDYNNWIDFISVVPSYLVLILKETSWVKNLVIIRLLRVFKFFKLSYGLQVLLHTLKASSYELTLLLLMLLIPVVIFSSLVYAIESNLDNKGKFTSIPTTFWWCIITMTTVGYGDLAPLTWGGQMVGAVCAIFGILTVALPISVIGGNFSLYYAHVRARLKLPQKNRRHLQVNMHGLLRQTTSLSSRDRDRKLLRRNQIPQSVTGKVEPKRFLDKLFHKPPSPKLDINSECSPRPPQRPRGRGVRRTALTNFDSSDNESNDASATSSPFLKPEAASTPILIPNPAFGESNEKRESVPTVGFTLPDKRVVAARGRMRRTALINVESSDNESVESTSNNTRCNKTAGNMSNHSNHDVCRRVSETSCGSNNQVKEETSDITTAGNCDVMKTTDDKCNIDSPRSTDSEKHGPDFCNSLNEGEGKKFMNGPPLLEIDPGGEESDDKGIELEIHIDDNNDEDGTTHDTNPNDDDKLDNLFVNLDRLKTLSKSLDERMFFEEVQPASEVRRERSASRRDSMKLLTDCDHSVNKNREGEPNDISSNRNHIETNDNRAPIFPVKRGSIPLEHKNNLKYKHLIENIVETEQNNNVTSSDDNYYDKNNYVNDNHRNENGRKTENNNDSSSSSSSILNRSPNNKLKKNVSLPTDSFPRTIDECDPNNTRRDYSYSDAKLETDGKIKKKLARKTLLRNQNKMKSEGDAEDSQGSGDFLSPTFNNFRSRQMRKESIV